MSKNSHRQAMHSLCCLLVIKEPLNLYGIILLLPKLFRDYQSAIRMYLLLASCQSYMPSLFILVAAMGKCKQNNNYNYGNAVHCGVSVSEL